MESIVVKLTPKLVTKKQIIVKGGCYAIIQHFKSTKS
jgi:hypothetical protein